MRPGLEPGLLACLVFGMSGFVMGALTVGLAWWLS